MKENTYIIPGVDFYIGISINYNCEEYIIEELKANRLQLISFKNVDGLLIEDLYLPNNAKSLIIVAINNIESSNGKEKNTIKNVLDMFSIKKEDLDSIKDKRIDKVVEEEYEIRYKKASLRKRRIYNSFFERYQDENHQKTKERIKKLMENYRK